MTSKSSIFPRLSLGGNGGPLLPLHGSTTRRGDRRSSSDYDLSELSPRPSSPLLSPDQTHDFADRDVHTNETGGRSNRKGKAKAVAYAESERAEQFPPMSVVDRMRLNRENKTPRTNSVQSVDPNGRSWRNGPSWTPPSPGEFQDDEHAVRRRDGAAGQGRVTNPALSFIGLLKPSQSTMDHSPGAEVDNTFRTINLRERQIQKELQRLLDAQAVALERGNSPDPDNTSQAGSDTPRGSNSRASSTASSSRSPYRSRMIDDRTGAVIPVRQPRSRPPTLRQIRTSIARSMALLSDLKAEEEAYIASALSVRKAALTKADKLLAQHRTIAADLRGLEMEDPLLRELDDMQGEHGDLCRQIEELELRLKGLRNRKRNLEGRMEEVRSERESGLSGYRGALRETERGIGELMRQPGVRVLDTKEMQRDLDTSTSRGKDDGADGLMEQKLSGHEFMRMRPERRTLGMAKEWWEGELGVLNRRQEAVDRERAALAEGSDVWGRVAQLIIDYERRLAGALSASVSMLPSDKKGKRGLRDVEEQLFQAQYRDLRETIGELEKSLAYVEEQRWNLLVAAVGAELEGFLEGERILGTMMQSKGYSVPEVKHEGLVDLQDGSQGGAQEAPSSGPGATDPEDDNGPEDYDEDLTGSVVRRWGGQDGSSSPSLGRPTPNLTTQHSTYLSAKESHEPDGSHNNESRSPFDLAERLVPDPGLGDDRNEDRKESPHNEPPAEFLQEPSPYVAYDDGPEDSRIVRGHSQETEESDNEVPLGLLSEAAPLPPRSSLVENEEDEHGNEVPAEFLTVHDGTSGLSGDGRRNNLDVD